MATGDYLIKCQKTGVFFSDLYTEAIVITKVRPEAMRFADEMAAQNAIDKVLKPFYDSFSWHSVPADV